MEIIKLKTLAAHFIFHNTIHNKSKSQVYTASRAIKVRGAFMVHTGAFAGPSPEIIRPIHTAHFQLLFSSILTSLPILLFSVKKRAMED